MSDLIVADVDLYYLGIDKKQATFNRGTAQEVRHTAGTRFCGSRSALDYDWEAMFQWGTFGEADIHRNRHRVQPALGFSEATTKCQDDIYQR